MSIPLPGRTRQIGKRITAVNSIQRTILYTPSSAMVLGTRVNYNGSAARIRVCASIDSLPECSAPVILPTDTNSQKEQKNHFFRSHAKKGLLIYLESPTSAEKFEVAVIDIYNVKPRFLTGVSEFLGDDIIFYGVEYGWKIVAEVIDVGYGMLQINTEGENDRIDFTGFAKEESSFLQDKNDVIYNFIGNG